MKGDNEIRALIADLRAVLAIKDPVERVRVLGPLCTSADVENGARSRLHRARALAAVAARNAVPTSQLRTADMAGQFGMAVPNVFQLIKTGRELDAVAAAHAARR